MTKRYKQNETLALNKTILALKQNKHSPRESVFKKQTQARPQQRKNSPSTNKSPGNIQLAPDEYGEDEFDGYFVIDDLSNV